MPWDGGAVIQLGTSWQTSSKGLCARNCNCNCKTRDLSKRAMRPTVAEDIRVASSSFARAEVLRTFAQANRGTNQSLSRGSLGSSRHFRSGGQMIGQFLRGGECLVGIHGIWLLAFRADICAILCPVVFFECTSNKYIPRVYLVGICTRRVFINASTRVACRE